MMHTSELGSALRYRYRSLVSVFVLVTCACWWLFASHAVQGSAPGPGASLKSAQQATAAAAPPQSNVSPASAPGSLILLPHPDLHPVRPHPPAAVTRNAAEVRQLQLSLWNAIERKNTIESRLAELSIPAAPIVRQPAAIAAVTPELRAATARVATAKTALTELEARYTDAYPDVVQAKEELAEAEQSLYSARHLASSTPARPRTVAPLPPSPQVEAERAALHSELAGLATSIPDLKSQLAAASSLPLHAPKASAPRDEPYWPLVLPQTAVPAASSVPAAPSVSSASSPAPVVATSASTPLPAPGVTARLFAAHSLLFLPQSMLLGLFASGILFFILESTDHTIKGPESIRQALPVDARQISLRSMRA